MPPKPTLALLLTTLLTLPQPTPSTPTPKTQPCSQTLLSNAASAYLTAQTLGSLSPLEPLLTPNWTYVENNKKQQPTANTILSTRLKISLNRTIYDLDACATYTEVIAPDDGGSGGGVEGWVVGTQIRHSSSSTTPSQNPAKAPPPQTQSITTIDTITTTARTSWLFNASSTLLHAARESWDPILPPSLQDSRALLQSAADAYLDMWSDPTARARVPWGKPCARLEGGAYTGKGSPEDSCEVGAPTNSSQKGNSRRRYVVDVERGSVGVFCVWGHMMDAADSHQFRLERGKLRYIHTMTSCGDRVCRL